MTVKPLRCISLTLGSLVAGLSAIGAETDRPNIIVILADDLGYGDVRCLNPESKIPTPNLDRLAQRGITFTDAHSSSALCSPTRYGLLTGRYSWRTRPQGGALWSFAPPMIEEGRMTVASYLRARGYHTACVGKWHLGMHWRDESGAIMVNTGAAQGWNVDFKRPLENGPTAGGFDYFFGMDAPNYPPYCYIENDRTLGIPTVAKPTAMHGVPGAMLEGWDLVAVLPELERRAVQYIDEQAGTEQPFFLYFPITAPHTPICPTDEHVGKSQAGAYGDFVHQIDAIVARIQEALERNGLTENTLLFFTSDNGSPRMDGRDMAGGEDTILKLGHDPSYVFRGRKADVWEGGHHVPFFAQWPARIPAGTVSDEVVCLTDLFATIAAILGDEPPDDAAEDSYDISPALMGKPREGPIREATVHLAGDGSLSIRQGQWKLALCPGSGGGSLPPETAMRLGLPMVQLYDLEQDLGEENNLQAEHPDVVYRLTRLLESYVEKGRSTPGAAQENTRDPDLWASMAIRNEKYDTGSVEHLAVGKTVRLESDVSLAYTEIGIGALTDGIRASCWHDDGFWIGVEGKGLEVVLDLGRPRAIEAVTAGFLEAQAYWIFPPRKIEVTLSIDGREYQPGGVLEVDDLTQDDRRHIRNLSVGFERQECRFVKVRAVGVGVCPEWHKGAGGRAWIFADEIIVE